MGWETLANIRPATTILLPFLLLVQSFSRFPLLQFSSLSPRYVSGSSHHVFTLSLLREISFSRLVLPFLPFFLPFSFVLFFHLPSLRFVSFGLSASFVSSRCTRGLSHFRFFFFRASPHSRLSFLCNYFAIPNEVLSNSFIKKKKNRTRTIVLESSSNFVDLKVKQIILVIPKIIKITVPSVFASSFTLEPN